MTDSKSSDCDRFLDLLNQVLDGDLPARVLVQDPHYSLCQECRPLTAMVDALQHYSQAPVMVPSALTERITQGAVQDYRFRRNVKSGVRLGGMALAASLLLAIGIPYFQQAHPERNGAMPRPVVAVKMQSAETPQVSESLSQVGNALVSLSLRTADESLSPAMSLFTPPREKESEQIASDSSSVVISELPQAVKSSLEPVASTPLRALNYFVRDFAPAVPGPKSKS